MLYNINPKLWGKSYWDMSHYLTMAYPENPTEDDKNNIKQYFTLLQNILPCENCRKHYKQNLADHPLTDDILSSRYKLITWLVDLHNEVNKKTGSQEMTVEQTIRYYSGHQNDTSNTHQIAIILLLIIIIFVIIYYIRK